MIKSNIDMRAIWAQKIKEIDEAIRNTSCFNIKRLNELGSRKEWLEFGFQACGGSGK